MWSEEALNIVLYVRCRQSPRPPRQNAYVCKKIRTMSPSTPPSQERQKRARGARSVLGCLTCRRRRVKCTVHKSPCHNCQHLNLTCTPSFHYNFKNWTPTDTTQQHVENPPGGSQSEPTMSPTSQAHESGDAEDLSAGNSQIAENLPQDILFWLSTGLNNGSCDMATSSMEPDSENQSSPPQKHRNLPFSVDFWDSLSLQNISNNGYNDLFELSTYGNRIPQLDATATERNDDAMSVPSNHDNQTNFNGMLEQLATISSTSGSFGLSNIWNIPPQVPQIFGNSPCDMAILNQHESNMPKLLTAKTSPWNPFSYMLNSTRNRPESPLRHGILSWTSCYLSCKEQNPTHSGVAYYVSALKAVKDIISELRGDVNLEGFSRRPSSKSEKLYMLLSTSYFLSQCDVMLCDYKSLYDRLDSIRDLFEEHWGGLNGSLSTLDRRLLTWLAYLDLRSSLFGNQRFRRPRRLTKQRDLISVLIDLDGLSSLRVVSGGQSYLSACYGDTYPATELQDDLRQEPCHTKCDDVLSIFSSLNNFETWNDEHPPNSGGDMLEELRSAKIQALRANLSRIRAVSNKFIETLENKC
jgi:hypothetical protein